MMDQSNTLMEYKKTSCYFCSEWLENGSFKEHVRSCGQVLERCPNNCLAYVQRKSIETHLKECPKTARLQNDNNFATLQDFSLMENRLIALEEDIQTYRSALNEEIRQRLHLITDIGALKRKNQVTDEWVTKVSDILAALKKCMNEETQSRCIDMEKCREDIGRLMFQYHNVDEWRMEMNLRLDGLQSDVVEVEENNWRGHLELLEDRNAEQSVKIAKLENELEELRTQIKDLDHTNYSHSIFMTNEKFGAVDLILEDQHKLLNSTKTEINKTIATLKSDTSAQSKLIADLATKQNKLDFELKNMKHIVLETEDKCDKFDKVSNATKAAANQTRQEMNDLEVHLTYQKKLFSLHNVRGHLIWKIDGYAAKLTQAKESQSTPIRSPIFSNKQYGYTLRLDVFLNGIGTWKGRNIIACLSIVPGEYDMLLPFPVRIDAEITLRDQPENLSEAQNITKFLVAKRKNDVYETNQYIHIPHKILHTRNYVKNDAIFFEVRILKCTQ
ncbi:TNF receptor-associated factor 3 [Sergentomyia squamirostris]